MVTVTDDNMRQTYIEKMGEQLGSQFDILCREVTLLHIIWFEYRQLFCRQDRVNILNRSAPGIFRIIQHALLETIVLRIVRLIDPKQTAGKDNLTILALPQLTYDHKNDLTDMYELVEKAKSIGKDFRDLRNRTIAHLDLNFYTNPGAVPRESANKEKVRDAIDILARIIQLTHLYYMENTLVLFNDGVGGAGNALRMFGLLEDGLKAQEESTLREYPF